MVYWTVLSVAMGWGGITPPRSNHCLVPSAIPPTIDSCRPVPNIGFVRCNLPSSRSVEKIFPYRPVPPSKHAPTVPSRYKLLPISVKISLIRIYFSARQRCPETAPVANGTLDLGCNMKSSRTLNAGYLGIVERDFTVSTLHGRHVE